MFYSHLWLLSITVGRRKVESSLGKSESWSRETCYSVVSMIRVRHVCGWGKMLAAEIEVIWEDLREMKLEKKKIIDTQGKIDWIYTLVSLKGWKILKEVINNWISNKQFWRSLYIEEVINNSVFWKATICSRCLTSCLTIWHILLKLANFKINTQIFIRQAKRLLQLSIKNINFFLIVFYHDV